MKTFWLLYLLPWVTVLFGDGLIFADHIKAGIWICAIGFVGILVMEQVRMRRKPKKENDETSAA